MRKLRIKTLSTAIGGEGEVLNPDPGDGWGGGPGGCTRECYTTCTGPQGVECCCYYHCASGTSYGCQQGVYCSNTSTSCQ